MLEVLEKTGVFLSLEPFVGRLSRVEMKGWVALGVGMELLRCALKVCCLFVFFGLFEAFGHSRSKLCQNLLLVLVGFEVNGCGSFKFCGVSLCI